VNPGVRSTSGATSLSAGAWTSFHSVSAATPISDVGKLPPESKKLETLMNEGVLSSLVYPIPEITVAGTANQMPRDAGSSLPRDVTDFSRRDAAVWVYALMLRKGKQSKGELALAVFDTDNKQRVTSPPKKISLQDVPERLSMSFPPANLTAGVYRVDLIWNGRPVWRTFIRITD